MDRDVRAKALGYAAKAVLSAAFLAACGGSGSETATDDNASQPTDDEIIKAAPPCEKGLAKLKEVFPAGDKQFWNHTKAEIAALKGDKDVTACCESLIKSSNDTNLSQIGKFRSAGCCAADFSEASGNTSGNAPALTACTPWGPPVPPAMIA
jgi:hypothetical protein